MTNPSARVLDTPFGKVSIEYSPTDAIVFGYSHIKVNPPIPYALDHVWFIDDNDTSNRGD